MGRFSAEMCFSRKFGALWEGGCGGEVRRRFAFHSGVGRFPAETVFSLGVSSRWSLGRVLQRRFAGKRGRSRTRSGAKRPPTHLGEGASTHIHAVIKTLKRYESGGCVGGSITSVLGMHNVDGPALFFFCFASRATTLPSYSQQSKKSRN